jgi:hypothetical protein
MLRFFPMLTGLGRFQRMETLSVELVPYADTKNSSLGDYLTIVGEEC